jgi:putative membrane protein insertion efficiency factor
MPFLKNIVLNAISFYQRFISPMFAQIFGIHCRYYPSCSSYAYSVIKEWGVIKGSYLAMKRILKCNPFFEGGYDPPPLKDKNSIASPTKGGI